MTIIENFKDNYPDDPIRHLNFKEFEKQAIDCALFVGAWPDSSIEQKFNIPKYFFSTEEQAKPDDGTDQFVQHVEKIFTICPKEITKREKRVNAFFPFNTKNIPVDFNKKYEVIYTGLAGSNHIQNIIKVLPKYNYRLVSFGDYDGLTTDKNTTYQQKLNLIAKSKICITHNYVGNNTPQLKSRCFEAAFCKSLMLVMKDDFNIITQWFEPNVDFLYFDSSNIEETINDALNNYDSYQALIENAYNKAVSNYTTEKFIEKYIGWKNENNSNNNN
jgi:hypothetical protein